MGERRERRPELLKHVVEVVESGDSNFKALYDWKSPIEDKIKKITTKIYGASQVEYSSKAKKTLKLYMI